MTPVSPPESTPAPRTPDAGARRGHQPVGLQRQAGLAGRRGHHPQGAHPRHRRRVLRAGRRLALGGPEDRCRPGRGRACLMRSESAWMLWRQTTPARRVSAAATGPEKPRGGTQEALKGRGGVWPLALSFCALPRAVPSETLGCPVALRPGRAPRGQPEAVGAKGRPDPQGLSSCGVCVVPRGDWKDLLQPLLSRGATSLGPPGQLPVEHSLCPEACGFPGRHCPQIRDTLAGRTQRGTRANQWASGTWAGLLVGVPTWTRSLTCPWPCPGPVCPHLSGLC